MLVAFAASGGVFVLVGLLMERFSEKDWHKNLSDFRRCKSINIFGEWIVIFGIMVEIGVGIFSAIDAWQTRKMAIENDPLNKLFFSASARADIKVRINQHEPLNQAVHLDALSEPRPLKDWQVLQAHLELETLNTNLLLKNVPMSAFVHDIQPYVGASMSVNSFPTNSVVTSRESVYGYKLQFSFTDIAYQRESFEKYYDRNKWPTGRQVLNEFNVFRITQNFLPVDTEVVGGFVEIEINGVETNFEIFPQRMKAGLNEGESFIMETNSEPRGEILKIIRP